MRRVLSLWVPHFHTAVEALQDPALQGRPRMVVAGSYPNGRVVDVSPEAAESGVESGMAWRHAQRRSPSAAVLKYDRARYAPYVEQVGHIVHRCAPWVEFFPGSESELFADLGQGEAEDGLRMIRRLQEELAGELGLPARAGLATGKLIARAASRKDEGGRMKAEGPFLVPERRERAFLAPLPVETLWELKPEAIQRLHLLGLRTLGRLAALPPRALMVPLGPAGVWYWRLARGIDRRPVAAWRPTPGETAARFVETDVPDRLLLDALLAQMAAQVAGRLLRAGRYGRTVSLTLHLSGGPRLFATRHLKAPTHLPRPLEDAARALLEQLLVRIQGSGFGVQGSVPQHPTPNTQRPSIEVLELSVTGLETGSGLQLSFFGDESRAPALRAALARVRNRYGERSLTSARGILNQEK